MLYLGVFILFVILLVAYASSRPDHFQVERSVVIGAPPEHIFPLVRDFHLWDKWSPYEHLDPTMKKEFSGSEAGVGARYAWSGNGKAGEGKMEVTEEISPKKLVIALSFTRPMVAQNLTVFEFVPSDGGTRVSWNMSGNNSLFSKIFQLCISMEKLV